MKLNRRLIALGLITFLIFLLLSAPASLITNLLTRQTGMEFTSTSGTIWHGHAKQITGPNIAIGPVEWKIRPWYLLRAQLAADILIHKGSSSDDVAGSLWLSAGLPASINVRDANLNADAAWVFSVAAIPIAANGRFYVRMPHLRARAGTLPQVEANINWRQAGISYPHEYNLGTYSVAIRHQPETDPQFIVATVSDENSMLHVNGQAKIDQGGAYQLDLNVSADSVAPLAISRVLPMLGNQQSDGSVQIKRNGNLSEFM